MPPSWVTLARGVAAAWLLATLPRGTRGYQRDASSAGGSRALPRLWPRPTAARYHDGPASHAWLTLRPCEFDIRVVHDASPQKAGRNAAAAVAIYEDIILRGAERDGACGEALRLPRLPQLLRSLDVRLLQDHPGTGTAENYTLTTPPIGKGTANGSAVLTASTYVGVLRGLETFSQLVQAAHEEQGAAPRLIVPAAISLSDKPTFSYRGILVDVARNFIPLQNLQSTCDALMYSKMNVLHLHLSDSSPFPWNFRLGTAQHHPAWCVLGKRDYPAEGVAPFHY